MRASKVKSSKQSRRLAARRSAWEQTIKGLPANESPLAWRRPGSNKK